MNTDSENLTDTVICTCTGATYKEVTDLFVQGYNLDGISSKKGVLSGCGGCEWDVEKLLNKLAIEQNK